MRKWLEIVFGTILLFLLIFRGAELWLGAKIKKTAATELYNISKGLYNLDIGTLSVGLFDLSVKLRDIRITTDSTKLEHLTTQTDTNDMLAIKKYEPCLKIYVKELFIKGIWFTRHPTPPYTPQYDSVKTENNIHRAISHNFDRLRINRIRMRGVEGAISMRKGNDTLYYNIRRTTIEADNYDINSDPIINPLHCYDIRLNMRKFNHIYSYRSMTLSADTLQASTRDETLTVNSLRIEPNYPKEEFALKNPQHLDWGSYTVDNLRLAGLDFTRLVYDKAISVDSVVIGQLEAGSYKDRNIEKPEVRKYMFYETLFRLRIPIQIRSVKLVDGSAFYQELAPGARTPGMISFNGLSAEVTGLSNLPNNPAKHICVTASGNMMNSGNLHVEFLAPARPAETSFEITGKMGPMNMKALNPVLKPLAKIRIDNGEINALEFNITGDTYRSDVNMELLYDSLYISLMKEEKLGFERPQVLISAIANNTILRRSNPDKSGKLHIGTGSCERDMYRSQFNYIWKSLYPGIKSSVGIPDNIGTQQK